MNTSTSPSISPAQATFCLVAVKPAAAGQTVPVGEARMQSGSPPVPAPAQVSWADQCEADSPGTGPHHR